MKIITKKQEKAQEEMAIMKLRFVARATLHNVRNIKLTAESIKEAEDRAEQVFYADDVI